jgi:hypothetical protein
VVACPSKEPVYDAILLPMLLHIARQMLSLLVENPLRKSLAVSPLNPRVVLLLLDTTQTTMPIMDKPARR